MNSRLPSQEQLRQWFVYDVDTGYFRWRIEPRPARPLVGKIAGTQRKSGYWFVGVVCADDVSRQIGAHRLAWVYIHGAIPDGMEVDHINCDPSDNSIRNLRLATSSEQKRNKRVQSNNRGGLKGAYYHACRNGKKWHSQIKTEFGLVFLGYYHTKEEAHAAYAEAAEKYFGKFARAA